MIACLEIIIFFWLFLVFEKFEGKYKKRKLKEKIKEKKNKKFLKSINYVYTLFQIYFNSSIKKLNDLKCIYLKIKSCNKPDHLDAK